MAKVVSGNVGDWRNVPIFLECRFRCPYGTRLSRGSRVPASGTGGLFSVVPTGLGSPFIGLTPDLRPGLSYAAPSGLRRIPVASHRHDRKSCLPDLGRNSF